MKKPDLDESKNIKALSHADKSRTLCGMTHLGILFHFLLNNRAWISQTESARHVMANCGRMPRSSSLR